jgi:DNA-binding NarL/FixJ family response regulator
MTAVAIHSADSTMRDRLARQLREALGMTIAGMAEDFHALARLIAHARVDAVLADAPPREQLKDWHARHPGLPVVALVDGTDLVDGAGLDGSGLDGSGLDDALDLLHAGAAAILPRSAAQNEIIAAIEAAINGFAILPRDILETLLDPTSPDADEPLHGEAGVTISLTPRELDVLAAMADGASNKAIARRLGISFHTAKFHVAAILAKLDADSRTEAVTKAAHLGLVML